MESVKRIAWLAGTLILIAGALTVAYHRRSEAKQNLPFSTWVADLVFGAPSQLGMQRALISGARSEIKSKYNLVQSEFSLRGGSNGSPTMRAVIQGLIEDMDSPNFEIFRLATGTNPVLVALNPNVHAWREPEQSRTEIAAYWPLQMLDSGTGRTGLVAICFGGQLEFLPSEPKWKPFLLREPENPEN